MWKLGLSARREHFSFLKKGGWDLPSPLYLEFITENALFYGGPIDEMLDFSQQLPFLRGPLFHGLGMSLASNNSLDLNYLQEIKKLIDLYKCPYYSEHLCLSQVMGIESHDLLPFVRNKQSLLRIVDKVKYIQEVINRPFLIENVSAYLESEENHYSEVDFFNEVVFQSDAYYLLDLNNIYVNSYNFSFDWKSYIKSIPLDRIKEIHLAGYAKTSSEKILLDTHGEKIRPKTWEVFDFFLDFHLSQNPKENLKKIKDILIVVEWDNNVPPFQEMISEVKKTASHLERKAILYA